MDELATRRIITLVDMDCFYCQVEARLNPELNGKPVVVVQYNQWKQGGIVAVSYEARAKGVTRFMRGEEALKKCPELIIASIPCVRGKADLTKYRDAGAEVAAVFTSFSDCVQRASIDEAFIDLTDVVDRRIASGMIQLKPEAFPSTHVIGYSDLQGNDEEARKKGSGIWLEKILRNKNTSDPDYRLAVGALVVEEMRAEVLNKTGFHCSAGIAHNKILAKLAAGIHKPRRQTVAPHESVPELYETLPIHKIRTLGGKMGKIVAQKLSISYMSELFRFSKEELQTKFDSKLGAWLYDIARGINHEPVSQRLIPDSIGCCKNFRGRMSLKTPNEVLKWLREMAGEVSERLGKDLIENKRRAKTLTISFKAEKSSTRSCPLSSYEADRMANDAFEAIKKFNKAPQPTVNWDPPLEHLGLSASKFISGQTNTISNLFKAAEMSESNSKESNAFQESNEAVSDVTPTVAPKKRKPEELEACTKSKLFKSVTSDERNSAESEGSSVASSKSLNNAENVVSSNKASPSFFAQFLSVKQTVKESACDLKESANPGEDLVKKASKDVTSYLATEEPTASTSKVDFTRNCPSTINAAIPGPSSESMTDSVPDSITSDDEFSEICPECNQKIHLTMYLDHLDYHLAMKLDKELNGKIPVKTIQISRSPPKKKSVPGKKQKKSSKTVPINQHTIRSYFGAVPKS